MKRFNILILTLLLVILPINISFAQYSTTAKSVKSDKGNVQSDLNNLFIYAGQATSEVASIKVTMAVITSEIQAISNNIDNIESSIDNLKTNDQTQETLLASVTNEINVIKADIINLQGVVSDDLAWTTNEIALITAEINTIKTNISTLENYLKSEATRLDLNLTTHEVEINALKANIATHETEINAFKVYATTTEARLVRATASYENRYKRVFLNYGYPIAINDAWEENKAADIHAQYDIIVIGDGYEKETHEVHQSTTNIINKVRAIKTDVEIFGYVPIGGELGANLTTEEITLRMDEWKSMNVTGIFLDEFGYDYKVSRERQNLCVDYAHSIGLNIIANSWNMDWVFNNDNGYLDWLPYYGNPNLVPPVIGENDYYLFENLFYFYENSTQKASDQWRIYEVYRYYYDTASTSTWGMNYYDKFHTKTLGLDGISQSNTSKDLYFVNGYIGGRILNLDGYGASIEDWGASLTNYVHYNPSFFNNETSIFNRAKIQPTVSTYSGATYAQYNTLISGNTLKLLWKPGSSVNSPTQGTRKVQVNAIDRTKCYVSSSATNANIVNTLVQRDASGNFSAGTITAALTGNASTATTLQTARNIAGVSFNGSANIAIPHGNLTGIGTITHANLELNLSTIETLLGTHTTKIDSTEAYVLKWLPTTTEAGYLYYDTTEAKVKWQMVTSGSTGVTDHTLLTNIGTKTHVQLEADITSLSSNATNEVLYDNSFIATSAVSLKGVIKTSEEVMLERYNQLNPHGIDMYFDTAQVSLSTGAVSLLSVCQLNSVEVMAAFCDSTTLGSGNLYIVRGVHTNRSNTKITWDSPVQLNETYIPYDIVIKRLSDSKFVILFAAGSATSYRVVAGNINSGTITLGASVSTGTSSTVRTIIGEFNETTACIFYCFGGMRVLYGRPFSIDSSNVITFGTAVSCGTNHTGYNIAGCYLNSTQNVIIGPTESWTSLPYGRIANINSGILTWTGTVTSLSPYNMATYTDIASLVHTYIEKIPTFTNTFVCYYLMKGGGSAVFTFKIDSNGNVVKTSDMNYCGGLIYNQAKTYPQGVSIKSLSDGTTILHVKVLASTLSKTLSYVLTFDKDARPSISASEYFTYTDGDSYDYTSHASLILSNDVSIIISNKLNGIYGSQYVMNVHKYKYFVDPIINTDVPYYGKYVRPFSTITHPLWTLTPNTKVYTSPDVLYPVSQDSSYYNLALSKYIGYAKSTTEIYIDGASELFATSVKYKNKIVSAYNATTTEWYVPFIIDDINKYPVYFNGILQTPVDDYSITTYAITTGQYIKNPIGYTKITFVASNSNYGNKVTVLKSERE